MTTSDFYGIIILRVPSVVYVYSSVSIWGGAVRGCNRKWRDRKSRQSGALSGYMFCACATESCAISALVWPVDRKWCQSRDRKRTCPEVALTGRRFCVCPAFSRAFFLVVAPWLPDVTEGHLTPFGVPLGVRNRKLCNTRSSSKQCRLRVFSMTSAPY
jgi:hypothetical protein